jgi:NAD-dependent dihydropyrimidine dehydrogenase PreA subunit
MKEIVFYFSGTGNSLSVAKALADGMPVNMAAAKPSEFTADSIGFVYPSYCGEPPAPVTKFIKESTFVCPYLWAVVTCGGAQANALGRVSRLLKEKGQTLSYGQDILLPDSVIIFRTPEALQKEWLSAQAQKVAEIKARIAERAVNEVPYYKGYKLITNLTWFGMKVLLGMGNKRSTKKCIRCTQCVKLCPTGNIKIKDGRAVFGQDCCYCFSCIQHCPNNAIRFGFVKRSDKSRYTHPDILAKELIRMNKKEI